MRRWLKPTLRKEAFKSLDLIDRKFHDTQDAALCISELSIFLRRVVLSQEHHKQIAGLTGNAWLNLLDQPLNEPEFSQGVGRILLDGPYQCTVEKENVIQLLQLCRKWVNFL
jgi:hypothetical protein